MAKSVWACKWFICGNYNEILCLWILVCELESKISL